MHFGFLLHGEGIVFSFLTHVFISAVAVAVFVYGLMKYKSFPGAAVAIIYVILTLICVMLSISLESLMFESIAWALTLPWNMVVPCYNFDSRCPVNRGFYACLCSTQRDTFVLLGFKIFESSGGVNGASWLERHKPRNRVLPIASREEQQ